MEKRMELSNSTYNHFFLENTHFEFCMSTGPHTYQTRNPLPDTYGAVGLAKTRVEKVSTDGHTYGKCFCSDRCPCTYVHMIDQFVQYLFGKGIIYVCRAFYHFTDFILTTHKFKILKFIRIGLNF